MESFFFKDLLLRTVGGWGSMTLQMTLSFVVLAPKCKLVYYLVFINLKNILNFGPGLQVKGNILQIYNFVSGFLQRNSIFVQFIYNPPPN